MALKPHVIHLQDTVLTESVSLYLPCFEAHFHWEGKLHDFWTRYYSRTTNSAHPVPLGLWPVSLKTGHVMASTFQMGNP